MMYKWFNPIPTTLEELKKQYRQLAKRWHPDMPNGDTKVMQEVNNEFDKLYTELKKAESTKHSTGATHTSNTTHTGKATTASETAAAFRAIIDKLITLDDIVIEICGSWVWVGGDTFKHREALKALQFRWSKSKSMWYWHNDGYTKHTRKTYSMSEIRSLYGSETITKGNTLKLSIV